MEDRKAVGAKSTPGPWEANRLHFDEYSIGAGKREIALVYASDGMDEPTPFPSEANAALIAAAPDLLAAAEEAVQRLEKGAPGWGVAKDVLRAAIFKATSSSSERSEAALTTNPA